MSAQPDTVSGMIDELQMQAVETAADTGGDATDLLEWEAAAMIRRLADALGEIAEGASDPQVTARAALNPYSGSGTTGSA